MMFKVTSDKSNKDVPQAYLGDIFAARKAYIAEYEPFESRLQEPSVDQKFGEFGKETVIHFEQCGGFKALAAEQYIAELASKGIKKVGYAVTRAGLAPLAIAELTKLYGITPVFFISSSRNISEDQAALFYYEHAECRFVRAWSMPTLNTWIRRWAEKFGHVHIPMGLANVESVTGSIVRFCGWYGKKYGYPNAFYCAVSTGTMLRGLEIGWPYAAGYGVAVARSIRAGEKGECNVISADERFAKKTDYPVPFYTTQAYDAKAYGIYENSQIQDKIFMNVGSDKMVQDRLARIPGWEDIESYREDHDLSCFEEE